MRHKRYHNPQSIKAGVVMRLGYMSGDISDPDRPVMFEYCGDSTNEEYGKADAVKSVSDGDFTRVVVCKVIAVVKRSAAVEE